MTPRGDDRDPGELMSATLRRSPSGLQPSQLSLGTKRNAHHLADKLDYGMAEKHYGRSPIYTKRQPFEQAAAGLYNSAYKRPMLREYEPQYLTRQPSAMSRGYTTVH